MKLMVCFNALLYYFYRTNLDVVTFKTKQIEIKASNLNKLLLSGVVNLFVTNKKCYKCYLRRCVKVDTVHMLTCRPVFRNWYTQNCVRKFAQKLCESGHRPKKGNLTRFFSLPNGIIFEFHMDFQIFDHISRSRRAGIIWHQTKCILAKITWIICLKWKGSRYNRKI